MTVWTQVSLSEVNGWLADHYGLHANRILPIAEGVEDSVFRLDVGHNDAVFLRLFERTEPSGPLSIASNLAQAGLPTCPPIKDKDGKVFSTLKGKPASLSPWVDGTWVASPDLEQIASIGSFIGRIARVGTEYCDGWRRDNPRGWEWFSETTNKLLPALPAQQAQELKEETEAQIAFWQKVDKNEVKHGPIHADMFRNNVMFRKDGKLAAVIDWGFCASDYPLIYDLAIVANDWCLKDGGHVLDDVRLSVLMSARNEICPLTAAEEKSWGMALRLAALRFYLSRQHDALFPRDEAGKTLDPQHFYKILVAHKANDVAQAPKLIHAKSIIQIKETEMFKDNSWKEYFRFKDNGVVTEDSEQTHTIKQIHDWCELSISYLQFKREQSSQPSRYDAAIERYQRDIGIVAALDDMGIHNVSLLAIYKISSAESLIDLVLPPREAIKAVHEEMQETNGSYSAALKQVLSERAAFMRTGNPSYFVSVLANSENELRIQEKLVLAGAMRKRSSALGRDPQPEPL